MATRVSAKRLDRCDGRPDRDLNRRAARPRAAATLTERFPAIAAQLATVSIAVDGEIYHDAEFVALNRDSEIHLLPPVSGGSIDIHDDARSRRHP